VIAPIDLRVPPLATLHARRSLKWDGYPSDVLAATVAEMDFPVAAPITASLHAAIDRHDLGYAQAHIPRFAEALSGFAARRLGWRVDPEQLDRSFTGRAALLSPLDRLVFDRKRMTDLFEFDYQLEMFKPAAQRRWGYWALPILYGDRLVGKLDATADRRAGVLRVHAIHRDVPFTKAMTAAVRHEVTELASWLGLDPDPDPAT